MDSSGRAPVFEKLDALVAHVRGWLEQPVVLTNGCFDPLHVGHVRYLLEAAGYGPVVVALNGDASTRRLKGAGRPVVPAADRACVLASIRCVRAVLVFEDATVEPVLRALRPGVHAKGTDYTVDTVPERSVAEALGIRTVITGDPKNHASRDVIARMRRGGPDGD